MALARTIYFVLPELKKPTGGANVIVDHVARLRAAGADAFLLYPRPVAKYPFAGDDAPAMYDRRLTHLRATGHRFAPVRSIRRAKSYIEDSLRPALWEEAKLDPTDIIVIPEYCYPETLPLFVDHPCVILAQDVFGMMRSVNRDRSSGIGALEMAAAILTTSEASAAAVDLLDVTFHEQLVLDIDAGAFSFSEQKEKRIAYMPRKRGEEAEIVVELLRSRPELADFEFTKIQGVTEEELISILRRSLIFLSFSEQEGFGLPPAEAMAAGCLVIGYTGVGGEEYFTSETGFPIPDSDIVAFVHKVAEVAVAYAADPSELDAFRARASEFVLKKYESGVATSRLLAKWKALEDHLTNMNRTDST